MRVRRRLIRARRVLSRFADRLPPLPFTRRRPPQPLELTAVRRRLELLLTAMYGRHIPIAAPPTARRGGWWSRAWRSVSLFQQPDVVAASDGEALRLPPEMDALQGDEAAIARYRLLAIEQAERVLRGTAVIAAEASDDLERDLFLLRESASIDAAIARSMRNVAPTLAAARAEALARRPMLEGFSGAERDVEKLVRQLLGADPQVPPAGIGVAESARQSLAWARETAARLRRGERYRALPPVALWGRVLPPTPNAVAALDIETDSLLSQRIFNLVELPGVEPSGRMRENAPAEGGEQPPAPLSQRADQEQPRGAIDDTSSGDSPQTLDEWDVGGEIGAGAAGETEPLTQDDVLYAEWDYATNSYRRDAVIVRARPAPEAAPTWATATLQAHASLVRQVRERFERLRARRTRLPRQRDGDELDLAAVVRALVDARSGHSVDDQLYVAVRPARRGMAILLLVDVSGSTDTFVTTSLQVIDVEKIALLLAAEALDALGDRYGIYAFSGKGASSVRVTTIKGFADRNGPSVRGRISALKPEANTRLGAAIRHATALLDAQSAGHRLLLMLSDGQPNDVDSYQGQYGVEDSRQAINEARARDVYPFCLTVDRQDSDYLKRIFGPAGYAILPKPEHLPRVLLEVVKRLLET
jgi:nitric oxide reductase NorD protein